MQASGYLIFAADELNKEDGQRLVLRIGSVPDYPGQMAEMKKSMEKNEFVNLEFLVLTAEYNYYIIQ